jgi:hypothetical protein
VHHVVGTAASRRPNTSASKMTDDENFLPKATLKPLLRQTTPLNPKPNPYKRAQVAAEPLYRKARFAQTMKEMVKIPSPLYVHAFSYELDMH